MTKPSAHPHGDYAPGVQIRTLTLTTLQQIGLTMVRFGLPALVPFVRADLQLSLVQVGIVLTALDSGSFVSFVPTGLVVDRWGERPVLIAGGLLMGIATAATALAPSFPILLMGLFVAGLGFPSGQTAGTKLVVRQFPPQTRGMAIGIRMSGLPAGGAIAALMIPPIAGAGSWRIALAAVGCLCALSAALCAILPRDRTVAPTAGRPVSTPLRELASEGGFLTLSLLGALLMVGQFTLQGFLALFLVDRFGWAPSNAGRLLALVHVGGVTGRLLWGTISDRVTSTRRRPVLVWVLAGGLLLLIALSQSLIGPNARIVVGAAFASGVFLAGWNALFMNLVTEHAGVARAATAVGGVLTVMFLTTMASYPLFGSVVQATRSYETAWLLMAACQAAALLMLTRVQER